MGFMDKAKQLAEQAQQKLDEAQKNLNKSESPQAGGGTGVRYDEHGRPIQEAPPAGSTAPPAAEPMAPPPPAPDPTKPVEGAAQEPAEEPRQGGDANASPDPFKPLQ